MLFAIGYTLAYLLNFPLSFFSIFSNSQLVSGNLKRVSGRTGDVYATDGDGKAAQNMLTFFKKLTSRHT